MDLERLQVVISAKTDQLQKSIKDVTKSLGSVNTNVNNTEKQFNNFGNAGVKAFSKIIDASEQYNKQIKKIAQYNARYDIWGGVSATKEQPWVTSVKQLTDAIKDYISTISTAKEADPSDTLGFGKMHQEIGGAVDAVKRFNAILTEIYADRGPNEQLRMTAELEALAVKSKEVKTELESLYSDMQLISKIESGHIEGTPDTMKQIERYNSLDVDKIKSRYAELQDQFASIRREIDETIKAMGGLEAVRFDSAKQEADLLHRILIKIHNVALNVKNAIAGWRLDIPFKSFAMAIGQATKGLGNMMWQLEPLHKIIGKISDGLHSLGLRIKRVLVYSTIVAFFRNVKNQISGYLTANAELMNALGQAKGAWITAFMPILNYVIPKIIALINWLTILGQKIAMLTARIFGGSVKASQQQAKALQAVGGAAGGAAAEFKPLLAAFDELNRLEEPDAGGGGAGADLSEPTFDFDESELKDYLTWYDWLYDKTERLLEIHKKLDTWLQKCAKSINRFAENMYQMFRGDNLQMAEAMTRQFEKLGKTLAEALNHFVNAINWEMIGKALGAGLDLALSWLVSFVYTFDWRKLASSIASAINGAISEINWTNVGKLLAGYWNVVWQAFVGFVSTIDWTSLGTAIADTINGALEAIDIESFEEGVNAVCEGLFQGFIALVENLDWALLGERIIQLIIAALRGAISTSNLDLLFFGLGSTMSDKTTEGFESGKPELQKSVDDGITNTEQRFQKGWQSINSDSNSQWARTRSDIAEKIEGIKSDATTKFDNIKSKLSTSSQNTKTAVIGAFQTLSSGISPVLSSISGAFSSAWGSIVSDTSSKFSSLVSTVGGAVATIGQSISGMLSSIGSGISSAWGSITGFVSSALAQLAQVKIPAMASGGVITQPTVGLVGEYAGAKTNPEIVTPENLLRNIIGESNDDVADVLVQGFRQIITAINDKETEIRIGDDVISAAAARGDKDFKRRTGRSQFA